VKIDRLEVIKLHSFQGEPSFTFKFNSPPGNTTAGRINWEVRRNNTWKWAGNEHFVIEPFAKHTQHAKVQLLLFTSPLNSTFVIAEIYASQLESSRMEAIK
jgi:hypothetical protein